MFALLHKDASKAIYKKAHRSRYRNAETDPFWTHLISDGTGNFKCRVCGEKITRGSHVIQFYWAFSWEAKCASLCQIHYVKCIEFPKNWKPYGCYICFKGYYKQVESMKCCEGEK